MANPEQALYTELAQRLVTPKRFGGVVLAEVVELYPDVPEVRRQYGQPVAPDTEPTLQRLDRLGRL